MSLSHVTATRNALADLVVDQLDSGNLVIMTDGDVEVATCPLASPAFGDAVAGTATANDITEDASATGGEAALFKFETSGNAEVFRGGVETSGATEEAREGKIILTSLSISAGDTVQISSFTYSASL